MAARERIIFISSPMDVAAERRAAMRVIARLNGRFRGWFDLKAIFHENEAIHAGGHFQRQLPDPSKCDFFVCIVWSRIGTPLLRDDRYLKPDGKGYYTGTEWEFENAASKFRETQKQPIILVYEKTADRQFSLDNFLNEESAKEIASQYNALEEWKSSKRGTPKDGFQLIFHRFNDIDQFEETLERHLSEWLNKQRREETSPSELPTIWKPDESPFPGLSYFSDKLADVFRGRDRAIRTILRETQKNANAGCAFLLILGRSGSGKSSLIRAGLIPTATQAGIVDGIDFWRTTVVLPTIDLSPDPCEGLAHTLCEDNVLPELLDLGLNRQKLADKLRNNPNDAADWMMAALARAGNQYQSMNKLSRVPKVGLLLAVDQLEELFTNSQFSDEQRRSFMATLEAMARSSSSWIWVSCRSDFYQHCLEIPELVSLKEHGRQFDLQPPSPDELRQIIVEPARAAGLIYESDPDTNEYLDETLHAAISSDPQALPLLQFVLEKLFQERTTDRVMSLSTYRRLGGLEGCLRTYAEQIYEYLLPADQHHLKSIICSLGKLLQIDSKESLVAIRVPYNLLATDCSRQALLDNLISSRLLVSDHRDDGTRVVGVVHEALLRQWPRAQQWLAEADHFLRIRTRVEDAAGHWAREGKSADLLLPAGSLLDEALRLLDQSLVSITEDATLIKEFVHTSWKQVRKQNTIRRTAIAFLMALTIAIVASTSWLYSAHRRTQALILIQKDFGILPTITSDGGWILNSGPNPHLLSDHNWTAFLGLAAKIGTVNELIFSNCTFTQSDGLPRQLPQLRRLTINDCSIVTLQLPDRNGLKEVNLAQCLFLNAVRGIQSNPGIEKLILRECEQLTAAPGLHLLTHLRELDIGSCTALDATISQLFSGSAKTLQCLKLNNSRCLASLTDLTAFPSLPALKHLDLSYAESLKSLNGIRGAPNITHLTLIQSSILSDISEVATLAHLREIDITGCGKIKSLAPLARCPELQTILINRSTRTNDLQLVKKKLPDIQIINSDESASDTDSFSA
jgi:hypothetical protein